jgi:citrate lyase subunit beta / citryl-CoA lyase
MPPSHVRRRSCLSVPASSPRMLAKAAEIRADEIVFDLEDAVAPAAKGEARNLLVDALRRPEWRTRSVAVRVNAPRTPWCHRDLIALAELGELRLSVVLPKVETPGDLEFVDRLLAGAASPGQPPLPVQALLETARGLEQVANIASAVPGRLSTLILGYADLAASLGRGAEAASDPGSWLAAQDAVLIAARANGLQAIDGPYLGVEAGEVFERSAGRAVELGFDGKWAIHPSQVDRLNQIFTPSESEVDWARRVIDALDEAEESGGHGAVALDGQMLDQAVRVAAERVLTRAEPT